MKSYNIHLLRTNLSIQHRNDLSLLDNLKIHGIHHEFQCRSGYCGACRVKMKKGKVSYHDTPLAFLNPDEILLCCCQVEEDLELEL